MSFIPAIVAAAALASGQAIEHTVNKAFKTPLPTSPMSPGPLDVPAPPKPVTPLKPVVSQQSAPIEVSSASQTANAPIALGSGSGDLSKKQAASTLSGSTGLTLPPVGVRGAGAPSRLTLLGR